MSPGSEAARSKRRRMDGGTDRLSALPDTALQRVLSFLPSCEVVQTCMLARSWRDVWKSARSLRVTDADDYLIANHLNMFVNSFLLLRDDPLPLDVVDINSHPGEDSDEAYRYLELWIRYGLSRKPRVLRVCNNTNAERWILPLGLITSDHLKLRVLELFNVNLEDPCLDFSRCPALENLRMRHCEIEQAKQIISPSVKRMSIKYCHFNWGKRMEISVPNLIFMELADCEGRTPLLKSMPLLESAFVRLWTGIDCCDNKYETGDCGKCHGCCGCNIVDSTCVLEGLSNSINLELTSDYTEFIFRKDLTRCPVFSKLKTLLLNEWCITANLGSLICFLQHSPILEKLILQFSETFGDLVETGASYDMVKEPFALVRLTVEVKCHNVDEKIRSILNLLDSYGVPSKQIKIQPPPKPIESVDDDGGDKPWPSLRFSFEQDT